MNNDNPLKESIKDRLAEERHQLKANKDKRSCFDLQLIIIIVVLAGLISSLVTIVNNFY